MKSLSREKDTVENWFKREWGGSIIFPDGWFGRPYDNQHQLTQFNQTHQNIQIILDDRLVITFIDLESIKDEGDQLVFRGFIKCVFTWIEYGSNKEHLAEYFAGEVKIISAPG
jgi:hypothetical protein